MKKIYLAGGCFWGVEHYMSLIEGVKDYSFAIALVVVWVVIGAVHTAYVFHVMHTGSENKGAIVYLITVGIVTVVAALIAGKIASAAVMSLVEDMIYGSFGSMFGY